MALVYVRACMFSSLKKSWIYLLIILKLCPDLSLPYTSSNMIFYLHSFLLVISVGCRWQALIVILYLAMHVCAYRGMRAWLVHRSRTLFFFKQNVNLSVLFRSVMWKRPPRPYDSLCNSGLPATDSTPQ